MREKLHKKVLKSTLIWMLLFLLCAFVFFIVIGDVRLFLFGGADYAFHMQQLKNIFTSGGNVALFSLGICCLLVGVIPFILTCFGSDRIKMNKVIRDNGINESELERDIMDGIMVGPNEIGKKYILINRMFGYELYVLKDIVWAYQFIQTIEHRAYGVIKMGTSRNYSVYCRMRNGKPILLPVNSEAEGQDILTYFERTQPHIILGYSEELLLMANKDFDRLLRLSYEKAQMELQKREQPKYYDGTSNEDWESDVETLKYTPGSK